MRQLQAPTGRGLADFTDEHPLQGQQRSPPYWTAGWPELLCMVCWDCGEGETPGAVMGGAALGEEACLAFPAMSSQMTHG